jgi:hypothetical protein
MRIATTLKSLFGPKKSWNSEEKNVKTVQQQRKKKPHKFKKKPNIYWTMKLSQLR